MAFKLFKTGDDLYDEGDELIKRGEFEKARNVLQKSIEKEGGADEVAAVKVALIDVGKMMTNPSAYQSLLAALQAVKERQIVFGLVTLDRDQALAECELTIRKLRALAGSDKMQSAKDLQQVAMDFQTKFGDRNLVIPEIFRHDATVTGMTEFFNLMAVSYEMMSEATVWSDPSQAAEYEQIAMGYRQQNGQSGEANAKRMREFSMTCKCWICGRIAVGEGVHFYSAPADVSPSLTKDSTGVARSDPDDQRHIYICRACYSAVSNRSDEIARVYYDRGIQDLRATEARLQAEIAALQTQIAFARMGR
jgi:hypothetical protein